MIQRFLSRLIAIALLVAGLATTATAKEMPACTGVDMLAEMKARDPASYKQIMKLAGQTKNASALLWKIERSGLAPSYLFGTMHLTDTRITTLRPAIKSALASSKRIVVEVADMSPAAMTKSMAGAAALLTFNDGRRLDKMLSAQEYATVQEMAGKLGIPPQFAHQFQPWFINMMMAISPCERARSASGIPPLDVKLTNIAAKNGIEVAGLETIQEQLGSMASLGLNDQLVLLRSSIRYYHRSQDLLETMIGMYRQGRIGAAWPFQISLALAAGFDAGPFERFRQILIVERNHKMHDRAQAHLRKGGTFIAVGALHLPGGEGLVSLLRRSGFKVSPVQ